MDRKYN